MKNIKLYLAVFIGCLGLAGSAWADSGKDEIGDLEVSLFLGADNEADAGSKAKPATAAVVKDLQGIEGTKFKNYHLLGADTAALLRSYENWARPLKPSEAIMLSFEPVGKISGKSIKLALELWQSKKKIMKSSSSSLTVGKPLYIKGPAWRGGYLIVRVNLVKLR